MTYLKAAVLRRLNHVTSWGETDMNMHTTVEQEPLVSTSQSLLCAHDLLSVALEIVDELGLPGEVGAHLDHSMQLLRRCVAPQMPLTRQPVV